MALVVLWRYSWLCVFLLAVSIFDGGLSKRDGVIYEIDHPVNRLADYHYDYEKQPSAHSIVRRASETEKVTTVRSPIDPPSTETVNNTNQESPHPIQTPQPPVLAGSASPPVDYNTTLNKSDADSNKTINPEDANRTSQPSTSNVTLNTSYVATPETEQQNSNATLAPNSTLVPGCKGEQCTHCTDKQCTLLPKNNTAGTNRTEVPPPEGIPAGSPSNTSETDDSDFTLNEFKDVNNNTLQAHNITKYLQDHHQYYNSSLISNSEVIGHWFWVNMTNRSDVQVHDMLSQSHRRAATVKLSFDFPFYGHLVRNVTIATGGFLYTGEYVHSWLAATQYIAPLMANFDTSISEHSYVKYIDNGTAFTVQWERVVLKDNPDSGDFTFQATLHMNGDIVFVYQNVPIVIEDIQDDHHPVKVGLSDAYIIDRTIFFVRRKTIYEYHRLNFDRQDIKNWTVILLNALPTCVDFKDCNSCLSVSTGFTCQWCPYAGRCSTGTDRNRQDWLNKGCDKSSLDKVEKCPSALPNASRVSHDSVDDNNVEGETKSEAQTDHIHSGDISGEHSAMHGERNASMGISGVIGILFIIALVAGLGVWVLYAYRNPHTASGQFLIRYRPSQWSWKRGEARYTAATIHM